MALWSRCVVDFVFVVIDNVLVDRGNVIVAKLCLHLYILWCVKLSSSKPKELKFAPHSITEPNVCVCLPPISCDNVDSKFGPFFEFWVPI